jgi:hypothetical protein
MVVEVDAMPGGYICSASLKGGPATSRRRPWAGGASASGTPRSSGRSPPFTLPTASGWTTCPTGPRHRQPEKPDVNAADRLTLRAPGSGPMPPRRLSGSETERPADAGGGWLVGLAVGFEDPRLTPIGG